MIKNVHRRANEKEKKTVTVICNMADKKCNCVHDSPHEKKPGCVPMFCIVRDYLDVKCVTVKEKQHV